MAMSHFVAVMCSALIHPMTKISSNVQHHGNRGIEMKLTRRGAVSSGLLVRHVVSVQKRVCEPRLITFRPFDRPIVAPPHELHLAPRPPPVIDLSRKSNPGIRHSIFGLSDLILVGRSARKSSEHRRRGAARLSDRDPRHAKCRGVV